MPNTAIPKAPLPRAPTLYAIIVIKLLKGVLFLLVAWALYAYSNNDLPAEYRDLLHNLRLNPDSRFWTHIAEKVDTLTQARMVHASIGTAVYSLFALIEGVGLMYRVPWAGWLSIGESAFFIPIEIFELTKNPSWLVWVILVLNIFMVWYLFQNRQRLFRHHHHQ